MTTNVSPYPELQQHLTRLGLGRPTGVALLPINLASADSSEALRLPSEAATMKTLLRSAGITPQDLLPPGTKPQYIKNNAADWIAPAIFIGAGVLSEHPNTVSVALNVLSNYLTDLFKGHADAPSVKTSFVIEDDSAGTYKRVDYEGPASGLAELGDLILKVQRGDEASPGN